MVLYTSFITIFVVSTFLNFIVVVFIVLVLSGSEQYLCAWLFLLMTEIVGSTGMTGLGAVTTTGLLGIIGLSHVALQGVGWQALQGFATQEPHVGCGLPQL
jgi:hypothetical protein